MKWFSLGQGLFVPRQRSVLMSVPFETFSQLDFRVGKIISVEDIPAARKPLFKFKIDFDGVVKLCIRSQLFE